MLKIGDIDLAVQSLNNEYQILRILEMFDFLMKQNQILIPQDELDKINQKCVETLQKKYPNSGIKVSEQEDENAPKE